jgi:FtsZ-interacting cell division protein ZipA
VDVDVLIGLNVIAQGSAPFPALQVGKLAQDAGMELSDEGVFHFRDERGESLFSLCNHDSAPFSKGKLDGMSTRGVTLLLDVPRVGDGIHVSTGWWPKKAGEFGGLLVDDNNRPFPVIAKIRLS